MDEEVDIVDAQNKVLYHVPKQQAHKEGLLHRTVISEIYDSKGRWLLVKQAGHKQDAGQYVSPVGGHVSSGESEEDALRRETQEEVGLVDFDFRLKGRVIFDREVIGRKENHYFIVYEINSDEPLTLNDESDSYIALSEEEPRHELKEHPELFGAAFLYVLKTFYPHILQ